MIEGKVERKIGSGRKRKASKRTDKLFVWLKKGRRISLKEVKETLNLNVSKKTIARRLHEVSFFKLLNNCVVYFMIFVFV